MADPQVFLEFVDVQDAGVENDRPERGSFFFFLIIKVVRKQVRFVREWSVLSGMERLCHRKYFFSM